MIVKNEAHTLRQCLESVQGLVSQIVVGDTGSTDNTAEIAREMGATVISVPWTNHFAEARNAALKPMTTDWVLSLDADEELDPESKQIIPALIDDKRISGYFVQIRQYMKTQNSRHLDQLGTPNDGRCERAKDAPSFHLQHTIRLFRRHPEIYYYGRIHEMVEYRLSLLNKKYTFSKVLVHHLGQLEDEDTRKEKNLFYRELAHMKVRDEPKNPFGWFELGLLEYQTFHEDDAGLACFKKVVKLHPGFARAWQFIGMIHLEHQRPEEALRALRNIPLTDGVLAPVERLKGDALYSLGEFEKARKAYRRAMEAGDGDPLIESRMGFVEVRLGNLKDGFARMEHAIEKEPHSVEPHDRLVKAYILTNNLPAAADAAERFAGYILHPKTLMRAASIRSQLQQWDRAAKILDIGKRYFPNAPEFQENAAQRTTAME